MGNLSINDFENKLTAEIESTKEPVECRICHGEDQESNMESPCSCNGTLKYAHRICIQRWCDAKGDITCEICLQQFKPGYSATSPVNSVNYGGFSMDMRDYFNANWGVRRRNLRNSDFVRRDSLDQNYSDSDSDEFPAFSSASLTGCQIFALTVHILPLIIAFLIMRAIGILFPVYLMIMDHVEPSMYRGPNWAPPPTCIWDPHSEPKSMTRPIRHLCIPDLPKTNKAVLPYSSAIQIKKTTYLNSSLGCIDSAHDNICDINQERNSRCIILHNN